MSGQKYYYTPVERQLINQVNRLRKKINNLKNDNYLLKNELNNISLEINYIYKELSKTKDNILKINNEISSIHNELNRISQQREKNRNTAEECLNFFNKQLEYLSSIEVKRFFPVDWNKYNNIISNIYKSISDGQFESAIANAQHCNSEIFAKKDIYLKTFKEAKTIEDEIMAIYTVIANEIKNHKIIMKFSTIDGEEIDVDVDIEYWMEKEWKDFKKNFENIEKHIKRIKEFDLDGLKNLKEQLNNLLEEYDILTNKAQKKYYAYVKMLDMQRDFAENLYKLNYEVKDNVYLNDDKRKGNVLLLENERGEKILIQLTFEGEEIKTLFKFNTLTNKLLSERFKIISNILNISPSELKEVKGYENRPAEDEEFDINRYRTKY